MMYKDDLKSLLWDASLESMRYSDSFRGLVYERDKHKQLRPASAPEETTTMNLVHYLAKKAKHLGLSVGVLLHSRALEGQGKPQRSGADLELALQLPDRCWIDLALQAKRLYTGRNKPGYKQWKRGQNNDLISWSAQNGKTPGMLLYNLSVDPFKVPHTNSKMGRVAYYRCDAFGNQPRSEFIVAKEYWRCRRDGGDTSKMTPAGVSLMFDQAWMRVNAPSPKDNGFSKNHLPLEFLAELPCRSSGQGVPSSGLSSAAPSEGAGAGSSGRAGEGKPRSSDNPSPGTHEEANAAEDHIERLHDAPEWVKQLQSLQDVRDEREVESLFGRDFLDQREEAGILASVIVGRANGFSGR